MMERIRNIGVLLGQGVQHFISTLTIANLVLMLLLLTLLVLLFILLHYQVKASIIKRRYTVNRNQRQITKDITKTLLKYKLAAKMLTVVSINLGMLNRHSQEKNLENATRFLLAALFFTLISIAVFLPLTPVMWYIFLCYVLMGLGFSGITLYVLVFVARIRFTGKLPATYKLINSRYIITGDIRKALEISMEDFDGAVRREMERICNALKKNRKQEIEETFRKIGSTYRNEYLTLLLNLIQQAHYNGGNQAIRKQFEDTTEEILDDIENQKDLSLTSRTYMLIGFVLPFAVRGFEVFNTHALGDKAAEFYASPMGIELKLLFFFSFLVYYGVLLFMERAA